MFCVTTMDLGLCVLGAARYFLPLPQEAAEFCFYSSPRGNVFLPEPQEQNDFFPFPRGLGC